MNTSGSRHRSAEQKEAEQLPPAPQHCGYQAAANSILMVVSAGLAGFLMRLFAGIVADAENWLNGSRRC